MTAGMREVAIIGAGPSGLALGACLKRAGVDAVILDKAESVGASWREHYDRLALHTARGRSSLPYFAFPKDWPRYVPRAKVVEYLERYAAHFQLDTLLGTEVTGVVRHPEGWQLHHTGGEVVARVVIMATGFAQVPHWASWPGFDAFPGAVLHTSDYKRPADLPGQRVLVIGFGNSGSEIAIDLVEAGRDVTLAVRSAVNILPKELFGVPVTSLGLLGKVLPYKWADALNAPVLNWKIGDYAQYGLRRADKGPLAQVVEDKQIPMIDLGTLDLMRSGQIQVRPGIDRFEGAEAVFVDGRRDPFDAVLMATGYKVDLRPLLGDMPGLEPNGRPVESGTELAPGLWTISYHAVPNGQLKEINIQARRIAGEVAQRLAR